MGRVEFIDPDADQLWTVGWDDPRQTWFAAVEPWPPETGAVDDPQVDVLGVTYREVPTSDELLHQLSSGYGVQVPPEVRAALAAGTTDDVVRFWTPEMVGQPPWRVGAESQRWDGYLDAQHHDPTVGQGVLRNLVGATTYDELRHREDTFVGYRGATLRTHGIPATYDLAGLQSIHRHLFQDVYEWAGEVRTVSIAKGRGFVAPDQIESSFAQIADVIRETDQLRTVSPDRYAESLARVYHAVNTVHPFREGNGRTQREFITALAREAGYTVDWQSVPGWANDRASEMARGGDIAPMVGMFKTIVQPDPHAGQVAPSVTLPGAVNAAYPRAATQATGQAPDPQRGTGYRPPQRGQGPQLSR